MNYIVKKIVVLFLMSFFLLFISACTTENDPGTVDPGTVIEKKAFITVIGSNETVEIGDNYIDKGATAKNEKDEDLVVLIDNKVDITKIGTYQVVYTVNYNGEVFNKVRAVNVIEPILTEKEHEILRAALAFKSDLINKADYSIINVKSYSDGIGRLLAVRAKNSGGAVVNVYFSVYFPGDKYYIPIFSIDTHYPEYEVTLGPITSTTYKDPYDGTNYYAEGIVLNEYNITKIMYYVNLDKLPS
ncbi:MAG TPA: DUF5011 domain-containing protein [Bacilli bacterium]|nr:DUF5011 domain-containing protein [Bacilli bacterium]